MKNEYNSYFFKEFHQKKGAGNYMDSELWIPFFEKVAQRIIDVFNPTTVLDAGCACGYLVAALRDLGVEAYGFDISKYAINNVREDIAEYCFAHSITDALPATVPQTYDLIVTTEVLEHLFPKEGEKAIENLCQYSDTIVFSSTPSDIEDRTHVNVQLPEYWAELFYNNSFAKNFVFDMEVLSPWCVVYERFTDIKKLIFNYELNMRIDRTVNEKNLTATINDLMESLLNVSSKFYFDDGNGFSEETALTYPQKLEDSMMVIDVPIPENTVSVRFHPVDDQYCMLKNLEFYLDNQLTSDYVCNGEVINSYILFNNLDPHFCINNVSGKSQLKIVTRFQYVEEEFLQLYTGKNTTAEATIAELSDEIEGAKSEAEAAKKELADQTALFNEKDAIIVEKTTAVAEKNTQIANKEAIIIEKDEALAQKDVALLEQTALLTEKEKIVLEKEQELSDSAAALAEKEEALRSLEESMAEKDALIAEKEEALEEKAKELEDALANQVAETAEDVPEEKEEVSAPVAEVDPVEILKLKDVIEEKTESLAKLDDELVEKNLQIRKLEGQLKQLYDDYQIETKENQALTNKLEEVQGAYDAIQNSSIWKMTSAFYKDGSADDDKKGKDKKAKEKKEKPEKEKKEKPEKGKKEKPEKGKKEKPVKEKKEKTSKDKKDKSSKKGKKDEEAPEEVNLEETTEETSEE